MKFNLLILTLSLVLCSCASLLNSKYQKVNFQCSNDCEIYLDSASAAAIDGKYSLQRNGIPKQVCVKRPGYLTEYYSAMQLKRSPLFYFNIIPFLYFADNGRKSRNYDPQYSFECNRPSMKTSSKDSKKVFLTEVSIDLNDDAYKTINSFKTKNEFINNSQSSVLHFGNKKVLQKLDFMTPLNSKLEKFGYSDSTKRSNLKFNREDLFIAAKITKSSCTYIEHKGFSQFGAKTIAETTIDWTVQNYYKDVLYTYRTQSSSGEFVFYGRATNEWESTLFNSFSNAMEIGLNELMRTEKMMNLIQDHSDFMAETEFDVIKLKKSNNHISSPKEAASAAVTVISDSGHGSGFFISEDGYVITNYHVVNDPDGRYTVKLKNGAAYEAKIIRSSKSSDLALLKIELQNIIPLQIESSHTIPVGKDIFVIGTPSSEDLAQSVSNGIISGVRQFENGQLIQTDAPINGGNSGGPIIDKEGKLIGVATAKLIGLEIEGIAFGIPAYEILERLKIEFEN